MKLDFNVLWFDDQKTYVSAAEEELQEYLSEKGFQLQVNWQTGDVNFDDLVEKEAFNNYDLILVDYQMGDKSRHGDELAGIIRESFYTDIIFYSGEDKQKLKELIAKKPVDGVYCANRKNLAEAIVKVVETTIRIFQHPNALRGMVMAETADFDDIITNCLLTYASKLPPEEITNYLTAIHQWVDEKSQENIKQFGKKIDQNPTEFLSHRAFQATHRLIHLIKSIESIDSINPLIDELKAYQAEVIGPRNKLAHVKLEEKNGSLTLVGSEFEFTHESLIALRKTLLKHGKNFEKIKAQLG